MLRRTVRAYLHTSKMLHVSAQYLLLIRLNVEHCQSNSLVLFDSHRGPIQLFSNVLFPHRLALDRSRILAFVLEKMFNKFNVFLRKYQHIVVIT